MAEIYDSIIIGAGQAGLALGYYLRRTDLNYLILDAEEKSGGAWQHTWDSLQLFSPAQWSSLPGAILQGGTDKYPGKADMLQYFQKYEAKYQLPIQRPVNVQSVSMENGVYSLKTTEGQYLTKSLICATGTFKEPKIPEIEGIKDFNGQVIHSSEYIRPDSFAGKRVAIIGEGNSGAQILAELSKSAEVFWLTKNDPDFLPDHVDGKYLFDAATQLYDAKKKGKDYIPPNLGDIVMVPNVKEARARGVFEKFYTDFTFNGSGFVTGQGAQIAIDTVIFCTGFSPAISFLGNLPIARTHNKIKTFGTRAKEIKGLWMVGYGSWTGFASATVIGVGRSAKQTINEVVEYLKS